jgi:hypothetical protein
MNRYYWLAPTLWCLLIGALLGIVWQEKRQEAPVDASCGEAIGGFGFINCPETDA